MPRIHLPRRTLLRGLIGGSTVALALPVLDIMLNGNGTALAQGDPLPRRFGVFFWGNGVRLDRWNPSATGAGWELTPELEPLAAVKSSVSVVSGMDIATGNPRGHHAGTVGILSGAPLIPQDPGNAGYASTFSAPSIDQVVAAEIGGTTRFRSLELGVSRRVTTGEGTTLRYLSHNGPDNANPAEYSPRAVFDRLFGTGFMPVPDPEPDPRLALRRSVLDAVLADTAALQQKLGASDKQRLAQHLESIRALERQIELLENQPPPPNACTLPGDPGEQDDQEIAAISSAMANLLAISLACDQTRVFSIHFSGSVGGQVYEEVGATKEHHGLTHDEGGDQPMVDAITIFIMEQFAKFLQALNDAVEGESNVLANSAILASTDTAEGQPHSIDDYPILVAGGAGGALVNPGIHYRSSSGENTTKVLLTLLRAMGLPHTEFGEEDGRTDQVVDGLLT